MTPFTINSATESDVPILLAMIRELAEFERLARMDDFPAGYAVYYHTFSTFVGRPGIFLDDIYVRPEFRKRGIGRAMLEAVAKIGMDIGGGRFEWIALRWNENAFSFYRSLGAKVMDEWALLRMNSREVGNLVAAKVKVTA
jgi:GNAT superfamily N-acetyltransferase